MQPLSAYRCQITTRHRHFFLICFCYVLKFVLPNHMLKLKPSLLMTATFCTLYSLSIIMSGSHGYWLSGLKPSISIATVSSWLRVYISCLGTPAQTSRHIHRCEVFMKEYIHLLLAVICLSVAFLITKNTNYWHVRSGGQPWCNSVSNGHVTWENQSEPCIWSCMIMNLVFVMYFLLKVVRSVWFIFLSADNIAYTAHSRLKVLICKGGCSGCSCSSGPCRSERVGPLPCLAGVGPGLVHCPDLVPTSCRKGTRIGTLVRGVALQLLKCWRFFSLIPAHARVHGSADLSPPPLFLSFQPAEGQE